jgi:hypothetical protein
MIELVVKRKPSEKFTEGMLYINGEYFCDTLEHVDRGLKQTMHESIIKQKKVYGKTCVPSGIFKVSLYKSPKFK